MQVYVDSKRLSGGKILYEQISDLNGTDYLPDIRNAVIDSSEFSVLTGSFYTVEK